MVSKANAAGSLGITYTARSADKPATSVSWNEAARFVNWLNVSSGSVAAYKFAVQPGQEGYNVDDGIALWNNGETGYDPANPFRNSNAKYFLPSENEWYKAAYYDPNKPGGAGYWDYATRTDTAPTPVNEGTGAGTAVYNQVLPGNQPADYNRAGGLSPYGTMGQDGNAWEWTESTWAGPYDTSYRRTVLGGCWLSDSSSLISSNRSQISPEDGYTTTGFRVASLTAVPEVTSSFTLLGLIGSGLLLRRRTKALR
jgi:formylglycine-generating enzyme required for sulfatase activity